MIDPVTLEVIHHRLTSIADEMRNALVKASFSPVVKEIADCAAAVFDAQGQTVAQALSLPLHLGTLMMSVPSILKEFPVSHMQEGDVFIANDPYSGGSHLPDITMITPMICQGEVIALSCSVVHHVDIGGNTAGVCADATSIYQEGLVLPPLKFYEAGKPVEVVHDIIRKNVRMPDTVIGDLRAQIAAVNVGKARVLEVSDEYGKDVIVAAMKELQDHSEALTRVELEKVPDGSYSFVDYLDDDGIDLGQRIKIQLTVTIRGSEFMVDFSGTSPQVRGALNCVPTATWSAVAYAFRAFTGASIPTNAGCFRPIKLNLPEGSVLNPRYPAAVGLRSQVIRKTAEAVLGALVKVAPERLPAASSCQSLVIYFGGTDPLTSKYYITLEGMPGGGGARPMKDGIDVIESGVTIARNAPIESQEMNYPFRILKFRLREGSAGAGEYRGGLGLEKAWKLLRGDVTISFWTDHYITRPWGLFGGLSGSNGRAFIVRTTGEKEELPSKRVFVLHAGDELHVFQAGGAGYGDPLRRKPELVLRDVLDRRVSIKAATDEYGVVINEESMTIASEKTNALRKKRATVRGPITWTYDRGPGWGRE